MSPTLRAFTLVELLVVVAIIAVLIAMLSPALEKAMYQAELAVCAARHRALGSGVTSYATDFKRWYPYRSAVHAGRAAWPEAVANGTITEDEVQGAATGGGDAVYDDRPRLRPYFSLNKVLLCPLVKPVDLDGSLRDTIVRAPFDLWFGWKYAGYSGMMKIGDTWRWDDGALPQSFSLLSATPIMNHEYGYKYTTTSHPDRNGSYSEVVVQDGYGDSALAAEYNHRNYGTFNMTLTEWKSSDSANRGPSDLNAGYADLSVLRLNDVMWRDDDRMALVPRFSTGKDWRAYHHLVPTNR